MRAFLRFVLFGALSLGAGLTHAALTCAVSGASLNFGTYNDASASTSDVSVPLSISCCRNPPGSNATLTIALGTSTNSTAGNKITTRQMKNNLNIHSFAYWSQEEIRKLLWLNLMMKWKSLDKPLMMLPVKLLIKQQN